MGAGVRVMLALIAGATVLAGGPANAQRAIGFDERPHAEHADFVDQALAAFGGGYRDVSSPGRFGNDNYLDLSTAPEPAAPGVCKSHVLTIGFPDGQLENRRNGNPGALAIDYAQMSVRYQVVGELRDDVDPDAMDQDSAEAQAVCQSRTDGWAFPVEAENDEDAWLALRLMDLLRTEHERDPGRSLARVEACRGADCETEAQLWAAVLEGKLVEIRGDGCEAFSVSPALPQSSTEPRSRCLGLMILASTPQYPDGIYLTLLARVTQRLEWVGMWGQRVDPEIETVGIDQPEPLNLDH